jgi:hypothetical protein
VWGEMTQIMYAHVNKKKKKAGVWPLVPSHFSATEEVGGCQAVQLKDGGASASLTSK